MTRKHGRTSGRLARGFGTVAILMAFAVAAPESVAAGGPKDGLGEPGIGQPENDTIPTVLTPQEQTAYNAKASLAEQTEVLMAQGEAATRFNPMYSCDFDPCTGPEPPASSATLATRARQQNNGYYCGPASGQVVVNWSRGYVNSTTSGETTTNNYKKQSTLASWMGTTSTDGTWGGNLAASLNRSDAVLKPVADWVYAYVASGTLSQLHSKIVTDVWDYGMPLVLSTKPHITNAGANYLSSWPVEKPNARHFIVLGGYNGLTPSSSTFSYNDSSSGYGGGTGAYSDAGVVVWNTNQYNNGYVVW